MKKTVSITLMGLPVIVGLGGGVIDQNVPSMVGLGLMFILGAFFLTSNKQ